MQGASLINEPLPLLSLFPIFTYFNFDTFISSYFPSLLTNDNYF